MVVFEELYHSLETFSPALAAAYPYRISTEQQWVTLASRLPLQDARRLPLAEAVPGREPLTAAVEVNGQTVRSITRATFVIDKQGTLRHALYGVNQKGHALEVLGLVKALGRSGGRGNGSNSGKNMKGSAA